MHTKQVRMRLTETDHLKLRVLCEQHGIKPAVLGRVWIKEELDRIRKGGEFVIPKG